VERPGGVKKWMRREIEATQKATEEVREQRAAQRDLLHEVADVVVNLQAAAERLQAALVEYVERYGEEGVDPHAPPT
jgi:uncharacterized coiled-coil protein SlyX